MPETNEALGDFFTNEKKEIQSEELSEEESKIVETIEIALAKNPELSASKLCADIVYSGSCGFANSGQWAYVRNLRKDRRVRATIQAQLRSSEGIRTRQRTKIVPAGGKASLGCTVSQSMPVTYITYKVIGCEML